MKELKFPVEIFPTKKKVLQIKEGVYWVKLLLPSMLSNFSQSSKYSAKGFAKGSVG